MNVVDTLGTLRQGKFVDDLAAELAHLVDAVRATGKKGTLTVKLDVALASKGDDGTLKVSDLITTKLPNGGGGDTIMYATADGALSRRDPRQLELDQLRTVPTRTIKEKVS